MNKKRWVLASLASFVVFVVLDYIFNNYCLKDLYIQTAQLWRPVDQMMALWYLPIISSLIIAFIFVYIYTKGYEAKPCGMCEGLRYGILIGLLYGIPMSIMTFVTMPIPGRLAVDWFVMNMVEISIAGLITGIIYKK